MVKFKVEDANFNKIYPVGSIYMSINETNPSELFGGEWERIKDTFLLASGDTYDSGSTGGSADSIVVSHTHTPQNEVTGGEYFVTNTNNGATNTRVNTTSSESNYADVKSNSSFHHRTLATTGESGTGKNMPPYLAVYCWVRTA